MAFDILYVQDAKFSLKLLTFHGKWAVVRHTANQERGDKGSTLNRCASIEKVGILQGIREPPVPVPTDEPEVFALLHWGTLLADGAKMAHEKI